MYVLQMVDNNLAYIVLLIAIAKNTTVGWIYGNNNCDKIIIKKNKDKSDRKEEVICNNKCLSSSPVRLPTS